MTIRRTGVIGVLTAAALGVALLTSSSAHASASGALMRGQIAWPPGPSVTGDLAAWPPGPTVTGDLAAWPPGPSVTGDLAAYPPGPSIIGPEI